MACGEKTEFWKYCIWLFIKSENISSLWVLLIFFFDKQLSIGYYQYYYFKNK